jgi:hypothetical protein
MVQNKTGVITGKSGNGSAESATVLAAGARTGASGGTIIHFFFPEKLAPIYTTKTRKITSYMHP